VDITVGTDDANAESVALFGSKLRLVIPAPRLIVARDAVFTHEQVLSVQFPQTLVHLLAIGGVWHATLLLRSCSNGLLVKPTK
jgi:hypothetical protein